MRDLVRILSSYAELDAFLEQKRLAAPASDAGKREARQLLNDQAWFLLCWGQLESEINEVCRGAIRRRIGHSDWQVRRSWYLYNPDDKRLSGLSFEDRAALVLDRDEGKGSAWAKTMVHYATRNEIAHGTLKLARIDLSTFVQDCSVIQTALHRAA